MQAAGAGELRYCCEPMVTAHAAPGAVARLAYKAHGGEVEEVRRARLQHLARVDGARADVRVAHQLRRAPHERQELVVVQAPHAVRAGGLQPAGAQASGRRAQLRRQGALAAQVPGPAACTPG